MKKLLFSLLFLMLGAGAFSQQANTEQPVRQQDYLKKSKNQKRIGTVLLLGGAGLIATGFIIPRGELESGICVGLLCDTKHENDEIKSAFLLAGGVLALASIPFYISSGKNRKRAAALGVRFEQAGPLYAGDRIYTPYPALSINTTF